MFNFEINNWFRALARFCDYSIFFLFLGAITLFLPYFYGPFFYYAIAAAVPFLWIPVEALLYNKWGTTPGKALFGITVRNRVNANLSYLAGLKQALFFPGRTGFMRQKKASWKRKLFAFLTCSLFVLGAVYGNILSTWSVGLEKGISPDGWVQYSCEDTGFKVSFPTDPEAESKELVIPDSGKVLNYKEITSDENNKVLYSVSHMELPRKWRLAADTTLLKGVLEQMVLHIPGTELMEKEFKSIGSYRVLDFTMKQDKEEVMGRLIIVSGTLYKLTITYPPSHRDKLADNPFLDSFEVS